MDAKQEDMSSKLSAAFSDSLGRFENLPLLAKVLDYLAEAAAREMSWLVKDTSFRWVGQATGRINAQPADGAGGLWGVLRSSKDATCIIAFVSPTLRDALVEFALGGSAVTPVPAGRLAGAIEEQVTRIFLDALAAAASQAFARATLEVSFTVETVTTAAAAIPLVRDGVTAFTIDWQVGVGDSKLGLRLMLPQPFISGLRAALTKSVPGRAPSEVPQDPEWSRQIETEIKATAVEVSAVIDKRDVPLQSIASMKVGDVVLLDVFAGSRCRIEASEVPLFLAELGKQGGRLVLRLDRPFDRDREFIAGLIGATQGAAAT